MKHLTAKSLATVALSAIVSTAGAASFDFVAMADNAGDPNYQGENGFTALVVAVDGVTLTATGTSTGDYASFLSDPGSYTGDLNNEYAYLDGGNAGLGVCTVLNQNDQCAPSSDDNVKTAEVLTLSFDQQVTLGDIFFRNDGHVPFVAGTSEDFSLFIDGAFEGIFNYGTPYVGSFIGSVFSFASEDYDAQTNSFLNDEDQFYIASISANPVPVPAAVWLLGSALGGLGFLRRKQAKA